MLLCRLIKFCVTMLFMACASTAGATEQSLVISSWASPSHSINSRLWPDFIKKLEIATKGHVTAKVVYHLASPSKQLSLIEKGEADIGWIFHGYHPHRFKSASLIELPGLEGSAEAISVAYWRTYERYFNHLDEYKNLKLLGLMVDGPVQLHTNRPVDTLKDIKNLKLRVSGDVSSNIITALSATSVHVPASHINTTLDANSIDGLLMPLEGRRDFSLNQKVPYVLEIPGGFSRGSFALVMNQQTFAKLPKEIRKTLERDLFGETLSKTAGYIWDQSDAIGRAATRASEGNKLTRIPDKDKLELKIIVNNEHRHIIKKAAQSGLNAEAVIDFIVTESQTYDQAK